ncbi:restriction endonuclease subunit S [Haemophilus parainfluenzae]|jgi:putative type I restriction enzyme specificity protein HI_0216|uniref:restriction endonuclease subunit S n=1 Tax=Haemophilus parainfluenzae TaxID=729 RepID=UPI00066ED739|nr:restriction endonuclease subunit S [Haemophilus parainfluenzae]
MKNNRTFLEKLLDGAEVKWMPLDEVANIANNARKPVKSSLRISGNIPYYGANNIQDYVEGYTHDGEFVLIAEDGSASLENYSIQWAVGKFWANNHVHVVNGKEKLNNRFLYHYLTNMNFIPFLAGKERAKLTKAKLQQIPIPIPPLPVQTEIVKILDALTALTSELTSELTLRRKQYEYYREKLLSEEELGKVGFEWKTLGDVAKIQRGASPRPISQYITDDPNGIPWIKIGDTSLDSKYIENTAQKITIEGAEKSRILKSGDFVMSNSMSYGRPYILKISGAIHDGWASISDFENILNSDFLYYYLSSNTVQSYWNGKINSSSVSNLNSDIIKSLPIPIPTLNIQIEIAKTLDKFEILTNSITEGLPLAIEQSQKRYEYYRELLLNFPVRE